MGTSCELYLNDKDCGDHPHAYGDKDFKPCVRSVPIGSSPRVWGQVFTGRGSVGSYRIIPTRMGTSCRHSVRVYAHRDHPHAYGDKKTVYWVCILYPGIIPTRMGTRQNYHTVFTKVRDHPHAYGDKALLQKWGRLQRGSSPRVWGQAVGTAAEFTLTGIIPTRMGTRCG